MSASSDQQWLRPALMLTIAAMACGGTWLAAQAAPPQPFPTTSIYHGRHYDPFDESAADKTESAQLTTPTAIAGADRCDSQRAIYQPLVSDPFERLPPVENNGTTANGVAHCAYQTKEPTAAETLPTPPAANVQENSEEEPGSTWTGKPVCELTTDIVLPEGLLPKDHWADRPQQFAGCGEVYGVTRCWPVNEFQWVASCLCHNPLYFEEINIERYGYGCGCYGECCSNCLQSAVSACHFFGTVPALPYEMAVDCPCECDYALGYYRPGSCPPWRYNCCSQASCVGALSEGGAATALVFLIP